MRNLPKLPHGRLHVHSRSRRIYWRGRRPCDPGGTRRDIPLVLPGQEHATTDVGAAYHRAVQLIREWWGELEPKPPADLRGELAALVKRMGLSQKPATVEHVRSVCERFLDANGISRPAELTTELIESYLMELRSRGRKPSTLHNHHAALSRFCRFLKRRGELYVNPATNAERPACYIKPPQPPTAAEVRALIRRAHQRRPALLLPILIAARCGLRRGEILELRRGDFREGDTLLVVGASTATKGGRFRYVPVPRSVARLLPPAGVSDFRLFPGRADNWGKRFKKLAGSSHLTKSPHSPMLPKLAGFGRRGGTGNYWHALRAFYATDNAMNGYTEYELMAVMGWSTPTMARHYVSLAAVARRVRKRRAG